MHTAPQALKAASAAGGSPPPPAAWPTGQVASGVAGQGDGRARPGWWGAYVPPTHIHQPGRERAPCTPMSPVPSPFCHSLTLLQSEATADPSPLPSRDVQACSLLAQGPTPPSSWTLSFFCLECHPPQRAHAPANTAMCPHVCTQIHVYPHTHLVCIRACVHASNPLMCTRTSVHTCTPACTHPHSSLPWPLGLSLELAHQLG